MSDERRYHDTSQDDTRLRLRNLKPEDHEGLCRLMEKAYSGLDDSVWSRDEFIAQLNRFPEGQLCIEDHGEVVAAALTLIVNYSRFGDNHTYDQITGDGYFTTHDPNGDVLYGVDVFVDPEYRGMRLGRRLYDARKELCRSLNLRAIIAGGRIPGYRKYADSMSPEEYIQQVQAREIYDPILSFQLANDFQARRIIPNYLPDDKDSHGYATVLEWSNIHYEEKDQPVVAARKTSVRVGTVQWQMRPIKSREQLMQQVEFFVDALAGYNADFAVFPEYFNAPLMGLYNEYSPPEAMRMLADHTDEICDQLQELAVSYNINIIGGSMPVYEENGLYNVAFLFRRDGSREMQYKLHATPDEKKYWGTRGGNRVRVFDTDAGRIGILICYDCEFPELPRLMSDQGMEILFVPYWVDTKNGYLRVQRCAQARAIENECYVAITGSVGNLPRVENADIQYSQSAIFTPADFAFPHDGIAAESTPNTEMTLIVDLDLTKLKELRDEGSVQNYRDRRRDLYQIRWLPDEM
ncbi:MAG: bifunctional GNAT family N-acetyltransferase/carbon-nitrogen hydrolase family protein [Gammaproteobacteria bacterium]|nr:bifunctional GNAT family N-acetyltransferase/carbon-nitrogen hydrolase family protein [Gammaproteobacteria bacterium]